MRLKNGCYAVVVGNYHSTSYVVGYVKYCPTNGESLWCDEFQCYERLVKRYDRGEVYGSTPWRIYSPRYGSSVPIIPVSAIDRAYDPRCRTAEMLRRVRDELEERGLEIAMRLGESARLENVGFTGSLLVKIHSVKYSDVDLVVYGYRDSASVVEYIEENPSTFRSLGEGALRSWCERVAMASELDLQTAYRLYRRWRRGLFEDREYSVIYNSGARGPIDSGEGWTSLGASEVLVELAGSLKALDYPSIGLVESWKHLSGARPRSDLSYVLSFEALYTPLFYEGGKCILRGLLQHDPIREIYRLVVGVSEVSTRVTILS